MKNNYRTIHRSSETELIINKSKFIGYAKPISNEEEAIKYIEEIRLKHKTANHNVPAYVIGENNNIQRYSDDGEPSGTAGIPVLEVIKKENLKNIVIVVTRYFGGIKLGTGGLVRAYTKAAKSAIESAIIVDKILFTKLKIRISYNLFGKVENELLRLNYIIDNKTYDDKVNIIVLSEKSKLNELKNTLIELSSANIELLETDDEYYSVKDEKIIK